MKIKLIMLALAGLLVQACGSGGAIPVETSEVAVRVQEVAVQEKLVSFPVHCTGTLSSEREARLAFKTGGVVDRIFVEEGDRVQAGQVLATLKLTEIQAQVKQAEQAFEKAERDFNRIAQLYKDSVVTKEQFQNTKTLLEVNRQNLEMAKFNLSYSTIRANQAGTITHKLANEGELINSGMPVVVLQSSNPGDFVIKAGVSDYDWTRLQMGDKATIQLDAYPGFEFHGKIKSVSETADPMTGTFEVVVSINPQGKKLASGFIGRLEILPNRKEPLWMIPVECLMDADAESAYVFYRDSSSNRVQKTKVLIHSIRGSEVAIHKGLKGKPMLVRTGVSYLQDGTKVVVGKD